MGKKGTPHKRYSKDEKMKYVRLHLDEHMSLMLAPGGINHSGPDGNRQSWPDKNSQS